MTTSGILLRREDVRLALREMDPENVDKRQHWNPGLSYVWHTDCYDKLKPYGISFHGCIDVYFWRIIWLEIASTNKIPELIVKYHLDAVKKRRGIQRKIRPRVGLNIP